MHSLFFMLRIKICVIYLLTNSRAAGRCPGPFYYTTNPWKSQAQNRRHYTQTLISRIVQPAGAAGVGRHIPRVPPTNFSSIWQNFACFFISPNIATPYRHSLPQRRTICSIPGHNLTLQKIFVSNFCNPIEEKHIYKKTHFLTLLKFYDII